MMYLEWWKRKEQNAKQHHNRIRQVPNYLPPCTSLSLEYIHRTQVVVVDKRSIETYWNNTSLLFCCAIWWDQRTHHHNFFLLFLSSSSFLLRPFLFLFSLLHIIKIPVPGTLLRSTFVWYLVHFTRYPGTQHHHKK